MAAAGRIVDGITAAAGVFHLSAWCSIQTEIVVVNCPSRTTASLKFPVDDSTSPSKFCLAQSRARQSTTSLSVWIPRRIKNLGAEQTGYGLYGRMMPQAIMAPEFPEGWVLKSSGSWWMTTERSRISSMEKRLS